MTEDAFDEFSYPLEELCKNPKFEYEFLLREWLEAHPEWLWEWREEGEAGVSLLHYAAMDRNADMVRMMLEQGADPNARGDYGKTPLLMLSDSFIDCTPNKIPVMQALLEQGADPNLANENSNTMLHNINHFWDDNERYTAIALLIAYGADINKPDDWGRTPLYYCYGETLTVLVGHGASVNHTDNDGVSPLYRASYCRIPDDVEILHSHGADPNLCNHQGNSPLHYAATKQAFHPTLKALLKAGSDFHHRNRNGFTPLHFAASVHAFESVSFLLTAGADINARDNQGRTALNLVENDIYLGCEISLKKDKPFHEDLYHSLSTKRRKAKMLTLLKKAGAQN